MTKKITDRKGTVEVDWEVFHYEYDEPTDDQIMYDVQSGSEWIESDDWFEDVDDAEDWIVRALGGRRVERFDLEENEDYE